MPAKPRAVRIFALLCLLAVACAQVFGVDRAYLCLCAGLPVETSADHCHGPHGAACVDQEMHEHEGEKDGDAEEHAAVTRALQLVKPAPFIPPLWTPVLLAVLPLTVNGGAEFAPAAAAQFALDAKRRPPAGMLAAKTVVLLI